MAQFININGTRINTNSISMFEQSGEDKENGSVVWYSNGVSCIRVSTKMTVEQIDKMIGLNGGVAYHDGDSVCTV